MKIKCDIYIFLFIFLIFTSEVLTKKKFTTDYQYQKNLEKLYTKMHRKSATQNDPSKYLKFIAGMGIGFGLSVDASEELKNCFIRKENHNNLVHKFFHKANIVEKKGEKVLSNRNNNNKDEIPDGALDTTKSFTKLAVDFFSHFKDCAPFRETFFSFLRNRIINLGIKGVAYAVGGVIGVLLKSGHDLFKLLSEMRNFYTIRSTHPIDYYNLGSSVGKIIYYTQNLIIKKKR
jgi:hypothetical protein